MELVTSAELQTIIDRQSNSQNADYNVDYKWLLTGSQTHLYSLNADYNVDYKQLLTGSQTLLYLLNADYSVSTGGFDCMSIVFIVTDVK